MFYCFRLLRGIPCHVARIGTAFRYFPSRALRARRPFQYRISGFGRGAGVPLLPSDTRSEHATPEWEFRDAIPAIPCDMAQPKIVDETYIGLEGVWGYLCFASCTAWISGGG